MAAYASSFVPCNVWGAMPADERRVYSAIGYTYLHRQTERETERERERLGTLVQGLGLRV